MAKSTKAKTAEEKIEAVVNEEKSPKEEVKASVETVKEDPVERKAAYKPSINKPIIPQNALVNVKSLRSGEMFYRDPQTQEVFSWADLGDVQQIPMYNLVHMKNGSCIKFYQNNMILPLGLVEPIEGIEPKDIFDALFVGRYYENIIDPSDFSQVVSWDTEGKIKEHISLMSSSARDALEIAVKKYVKDGIIDSYRQIKLFEKVLGCKFNDEDED